MNRLPVLFCALLLLSACASVKERVALVPDPDGHVGQVTVSTQAGTAILDKDGAAAAIAGPDKAPEETTLTGAEIEAVFGKALAAQPLAPADYILHFESGGTELTAESLALLPELVELSQKRQPSEVYVVGHTDTKGDSTDNERLGLARAESIRDLLISKGIPESQITAISHGEGNLLVPTADEVDESRNRRVEVKIR